MKKTLLTTKASIMTKDKISDNDKLNDDGIRSDMDKNISLEMKKDLFITCFFLKKKKNIRSQSSR
jgi:hypothetical protein